MTGATATLPADALGAHMPPIATSHRLLVGDARTISQAKLGEAHLAVTSPPYWDIKDYGHPNQIGTTQSLQAYTNDLLRVWRKCHKALVPGGRLVINIGDQYLRATKGNPYQIIPLHSTVVNSILNDKGMDFIYLGSIIWRKVSTTKTTGGASVMGSYPYPRSVYPCFENEFIAIFRKPGKTPPPTQGIKELARMSLEEWRDVTSGVWQFPGARMDEHPAAFPEALPERLIRMFTFPGETVLDPFVGSGTTMRAAAALGRNSVGVEIGFETRSGTPFQDVIGRKVKGADLVPYAGEPLFSEG